MFLFSIISLSAFGQNVKTNLPIDTIHNPVVIDSPSNQKSNLLITWAQQPPKFKGDFNKYVLANIHYSDSLIPNKVYISFIIEKDGSVTTATIQRSSNVPSLDKEILRVISSSPKWSPAMQNGHPVRIRMDYPIQIEVRR